MIDNTKIPCDCPKGGMYDDGNSYYKCSKCNGSEYVENSTNNADQLIQEITDLLIDKGCIINKSAVLDLAIYIMEREKKVIQSL